MKWLIVLAVALLALVLLVSVVGMLLPVRHTATASAEVEGTPDAVWTVMTDVEGFASWRPGLSRAVRLEDEGGLPVWREEGRNGAMTLEVTGFEPPRRMVARIADPALPFGGTWTYELAPAGPGTRVTITEEGEVYNPVFRFMARYVFGHDATMRAYLRGLEERMRGREPEAVG